MDGKGMGAIKMVEREEDRGSRKYEKNIRNRHPAGERGGGRWNSRGQIREEKHVQF